MRRVIITAILLVACLSGKLLASTPEDPSRKLCIEYIWAKSNEDREKLSEKFKKELNLQETIRYLKRPLDPRYTDSDLESFSRSFSSTFMGHQMFFEAYVFAACVSNLPPSDADLEALTKCIEFDSTIFDAISTLTDIRLPGQAPKLANFKDKPRAQGCAYVMTKIGVAMMILGAKTNRKEMLERGRTLWRKSWDFLSEEGRAMSAACPFEIGAEEVTIKAAIEKFKADLDLMFPDPSQPRKIPQHIMDMMPMALTPAQIAERDKKVKELEEVLKDYHAAVGNGDADKAATCMTPDCKGREGELKAIKTHRFGITYDQKTYAEMKKHGADDATLQIVNIQISVLVKGEISTYPYIRTYVFKRVEGRWLIVEVDKKLAEEVEEP